MQISEIVHATDWNAVRAALAALYPDSKDRTWVLERVYYELQSLDPVPSEEQFCVEPYHEPGFAPDFSAFSFQILSESERESFDPHYPWPGRFALDFRRWEECLGMQAAEAVLAQWSAAEITAHLIWEITFYGFTQEEIQKEAPNFEELIFPRNFGQVVMLHFAFRTSRV